MADHVDDALAGHRRGGSSAAIAFRVAGTGNCLRLCAALGEESETTDCLPDGERLTLIEKNEPPYSGQHVHPLVSRTDSPSNWWVSLAYLDHASAHRHTFDPIGAVSEPDSELTAWMKSS